MDNLQPKSDPQNEKTNLGQQNEKTNLGQQNEKTNFQSEETIKQSPAYEQPPAYEQSPAYEQPPVYEQPPAYEQSPVYEQPPIGEPAYDRENKSPSFFAKYWKYGLAALIPLLILGGVLLWLNNKDNDSSKHKKKYDHEVIASNTKDDDKLSGYDEEDEIADSAAAMPADELPLEAQQMVPPAPDKLDQQKPVEPKKADGKKVGDSDADVKAQTPPPPPVSQKTYTMAEIGTPPSFPGGDAAMYAWLSKNLQYPPIAQENGVQGTVVVSFTVGVDGSIKNVKVARSRDPALDKEALRAVSLMPRWNPGKVNGQNVNVVYTLPVKFQLQ